MPTKKESPELPLPMTDGRGEADPEMSLPSPWRPTAYRWSLLALLLGLAATLLLHQQQQRRQDAEQALIHDELARKSYAALQMQLQSAEFLLRAMQTLFLASDTVTATEFRHFYVNLRPRERFPGLLALAYAQREIRPDGEHYITRWVEPLAGNEVLRGLDVGAQPRNFAGLTGARDSDQATLSAPFQPLQHSPAEAADAVTMRLPIFSTGAPPTPAERRARALGSIGVSFRCRQLIEHALPPEALRLLHLRITDVTGPAALPLFDSDPALPISPRGYRFDRDLAYGGRVWRVLMEPLDREPAVIPWHQSILPAGLLVSVLLGLLTFTAVGTRQRALELGWRMSHRYRESEERFRALNDLLPALVLLTDVASGRIVYANQASRQRLGAGIEGQDLPNLFEDPELQAHLRDPDTRGCSGIEALLGHAHGDSFWASVAISRIVLGGRSKLLMVATDITEQRRLTERLSHQASHDALTELYNRREFELRLQRALLAVGVATPLSILLYIDLDQFKLINDTSGHLAGDQLLAQLAIVMRKQLDSVDVLARLGGDGFGVLATGVSDGAAAERIAERIRRCIDGYVFLWEQRSYTISASIGGVLIDRPGITVKDLLAQADTACYMAKELGRNRVHFYSEQDDETARRRGEMEWANRLRWAVDEQRLVLAYQEILALPLDAERGKAGTSVELLLRFRDEFDQLVVPGVFLPAAERYGLMPLIDRWVIDTALAHFDQLHPAGRELAMVAINLSGASIEDGALTDLIIERLHRYGVAPSRVCFEITETVAVRNLSQVVRFMERLRAAGCRIALDDFGAGMSSFTYLKNLPVDIIKIDGSFVRDMLTDPVSHLMVRAVTDIAHRLGLEVVAEWVTDAETAQALTALGVNRAQGFGLHRPELVLFQRG